MKTNKFITAAAVLALSASLAVAAPNGERVGKGGRHGRHGAEAFSARMADKLNLSEGQRSQIAELNRTFRDQNKPLFEAARQTRKDLQAARQANDTARLEALRATAEQQKTQLRQLHQAHKDRVLAILTPEQRAQLEALKAEYKSKRGNRNGANNNNRF